MRDVPACHSWNAPSEALASWRWQGPSLWCYETRSPALVAWCPQQDLNLHMHLCIPSGYEPGPLTIAIYGRLPCSCHIPSQGLPCFAAPLLMAVRHLFIHSVDWQAGPSIAPPRLSGDSIAALTGNQSVVSAFAVAPRHLCPQQSRLACVCCSPCRSVRHAVVLAGFPAERRLASGRLHAWTPTRSSTGNPSAPVGPVVPAKRKWSR